MAPLLPKATARRGTLHPEGNQECAHTNKTHTSVISLPGHLLWAELAFSPVFFSPGSHLYFVHMTLFSQSPVSDWFCSRSTNQPMSAAIPSYRDVGSTLSFLLLALACQAGLHILGTDTSHLSKTNTPHGTMPEQCGGAGGSQQQRGCAERSWGSGSCSREVSSAAFAEEGGERELRGLAALSRNVCEEKPRPTP